MVWTGTELYQYQLASGGSAATASTGSSGSSSSSSSSGRGSGSNFWDNIGSAISGAASSFGELFLTKELAKIQASTAVTVANANAQVAAANNQAAAAATQAQVDAAAQSAIGGMDTKTMLKWGGIGLVAVIGLVVAMKALK